jgi:hypothetical protein
MKNFGHILIEISVTEAGGGILGFVVHTGGTCILGWAPIVALSAIVITQKLPRILFPGLSLL